MTGITLNRAGTSAVAGPAEGRQPGPDLKIGFLEHAGRRQETAASTGTI
jgi:hypothetical protein